MEELKTKRQNAVVPDLFCFALLKRKQLINGPYFPTTSVVITKSSFMSGSNLFPP